MKSAASMLFEGAFKQHKNRTFHAPLACCLKAPSYGIKTALFMRL